MAKKKGKLRAEFRKHHESRRRDGDLTRQFHHGAQPLEDVARGERVSGKGKLTRKRTVFGDEVTGDEHGFAVHLDVDLAQALRGRVLAVRGLHSTVVTDEGRQYRCATRRLLKTLSTDARHVVIAGDVVLFRPEGAEEGIILRVEPRHGTLSRTSRQRQHLIASNVDQVLVVGSAAQPDLKPNLLDRFLLSAERTGIRPIVCINKVDLIDAASLQPLVGNYAQLGYATLLVSATTGQGIVRLRRLLRGQQTAVVGQSGVGKSSLLNAVDPNLKLRVGDVSEESQKGTHTTTTATLWPLASGGFVVDTPGIRQMELWDVVPEEMAGFFREFRPFVSRCRFPDCTHVHEDDCAVKDAVADDLIDGRRYESYCRLREGDGLE
ncbi:MAG: ribosome small subunit-dependent GTPase A [Pirellulales bacterium]|nr:ribosome small subunit-dependent GTPase A [Pirellulales bacterium]